MFLYYFLVCLLIYFFGIWYIVFVDNYGFWLDVLSIIFFVGWFIGVDVVFRDEMVDYYFIVVYDIYYLFFYRKILEVEYRGGWVVDVVLYVILLFGLR